MVHIEQRRKELKISQADLAAAVGVTQGAISMIENGERTPSVGLLVKIAEVLDCLVDELIERPET